MTFLVFSGEHYYPGGGWHDFVGAAETEAEALALLDRNRKGCQWAHIVEAATGEMTEYARSWDDDMPWLPEAEFLAKNRVQQEVQGRHFQATHVKVPPMQPWCGDCKIGFDGSWCSCGKYGKPEEGRK